MISTLSMHVKYGRSANVSDNASWRPTTGSRRTSEPWKSVWRSGYDGPWSTTSDMSGARNSLEKPPELTRSRSSVDNRSSNSATEQLRRLKQRAKGRYRRALNVSEASQQDSAQPLNRTAVELDRLDEIEDESVADQDRPPIPYTTCPKSAPAVLLSPNRSFPEVYPIQRRVSLPARSLSSQSYRALPLYSARKEVVADKIRSLGRILRRTESSSFSTSASEFPTPLDGRERRRQARNSYEMHSDSVTSSPLFNTPTSESAMSPGNRGEGIFHPLVRAGTLVATGELDRLSFLANSNAMASTPSDREPTATSTGITSTANPPPNNPAMLTEASNTVPSPLPQTDGILTPVAPANTPASDLASPGFPIVSRPSRHANRRHASRSRLSEVYNREDEPQDTLESPSSDSDIEAPRDRSRPGVPSAGKDADKCELHDIYHGLVPKPLSLTSTPPRDGTERTEPSRTVRFEGHSTKHPPQPKLDMDHLNELLDNAIGNSFVAQRLNASTATRSNPGGATVFGNRAASSEFSRQLKLLDHEACLDKPTRSLPLSTVGIRPCIKSRASSPGPRRALPARDLSSLASPVVRRHMAKHIPRSTSPAEQHAAESAKPAPWSAHHGGEPGNDDPFLPETLAGSLGHEDLIDAQSKGKRTKVRRSTSGTVHVTEMADSSSSSSSGTESFASRSDKPVAEDGCPQAFARMKELEEKAKAKLNSTMSGPLLEESGPVAR